MKISNLRLPCFYLVFFACCLSSICFWWAAGPLQAQEAPRERLLSELEPLVVPFLKDSEIQMPGLQVGVISPLYKGIFAWGSLNHEQLQLPRPDTIYEIASFSKPFVATLLARAVLQQRLQLTSAVQPCFVAETSAWCYKGQAIRWLDLATHSAGLPALPDNLDWSSWSPTRAYTREQLSRFLEEFKLKEPPGKHFSYSTLGYSLLGRGLEEAFQQELASQLELLTASLGMPDSRVKLMPDQLQRLAYGYIRRQPVPYVEDLGGLTASGGLKSSMADLLVWLEHQLGIRTSDWSEAIRLTQQLTGHPGAPLCEMGLGWQYFLPAGWYWHSASASGGKGFMAYDLKHQTAVVIYTNARVNGFKMEPLGMQIMARLAHLKP